MIHRNCEISIKKSVRYWSKKVNVLYNKHIKCRKSTEIVKNCTASADEPVERQTKES